MFYDKNFLYYLQSLRLSQNILIKKYYYFMLWRMGFKKYIVDYVLAKGGY